MANFYAITFYLDANGGEHLYKAKAGFDGLFPTFVQSTLNSLHSAPFISPHSRDDMKVRALWWGNDDWESDQDYRINDTFEGCTLILVDENLANRGVGYFDVASRALLLQAGFTPKKPGKSPPKEVLILQPSLWGVGVDLKALWKKVRLKALWKNLRQRWHRDQG